MRLGYRVAYRLLQVWTFVRRPRVRGAMVAVIDAGDRVLLVRHTYGDRRRWELPGGWVRPGEPADEAALREVAEELGIAVRLGTGGVLSGRWTFKREELSWFTAAWPGGRGRYDPVEIAEVAWFGLDALPARLAPAAGDVLDRVRAAAS
jgi:8-oxo-dGTP pyrophosphatase MutT (NUDIX family)